MGARQTRQSNRAEYCPVCYARLENRASATSHYRAHARRGELIEVPGPQFQVPGLFLGVELFWRYGMSKGDIMNPLQPLEPLPLEEARRRFLSREYRKHRQQRRDYDPEL